VSRGMRSVSVCDVKFRFEHHQGAVKNSGYFKNQNEEPKYAFWFPVVREPVP